MNVRITKRNLAIALLTLILFVMLPLDFTWHDSALEYMSFESDDMSGILLWIFYIAAAGTAVASFADRYDFARLACSISLGCSVISILYNVVSVSGKHSFISRLITSTQFAYAYVAIAFAIFLIVWLKKVGHKSESATHMPE